MTMAVLQSEQQISEARKRLEAKQLSSLESAMMVKAKQFIRRTRLASPLILGDYLKSWDVLRTVEFLQERLGADEPILDIGCYASEVLAALHKAGFSNLTGIDLNPRLSDMPFADNIRYARGDFMDTPFEDGSFAAITSISVIEHGFDGARLLREVSRLLRSGGHFIASFDYWPDKIDTAHVRFFDMDWLIFSREDVLALIEEAARHGLRPIGELSFTGQDRAIEHGGFRYTFAWLALQKQS